MRISVLTMLVFSQLVLLGCSAGISRSVYVQRSDRIYSPCDAVIINNLKIDQNEIEILGKAKVFDTGFSVKCDEEFVLSILRKEACALGADVINITEEKYPDSWSTCYRAKAEFIRLRKSQSLTSLKSDPQYDPWKVSLRSGETHGRNQRAMEEIMRSISISLGVVVGGLLTIH